MRKGCPHLTRAFYYKRKNMSTGREEREGRIKLAKLAYKKK
jgi:hypothetical protein